MKRAIAAAIVLVFLGGSSSHIEVQAQTLSQNCATNLVRGAGWEFCWLMDHSRGQGLEILRASYRGVKAFDRIGFPLALTDYPATATKPAAVYKDVLGSSAYSRGRGGLAAPPPHNEGYQDGALDLTRGPQPQCPRFLPSGTYANQPIPRDGLFAWGGGNPRKTVCLERQTIAPGTGIVRIPEDRRIAIWALWQSVNYRILQGYTFDADGTVEPFVLLGGKLHDNYRAEGRCVQGELCRTHTHALYWRIDIDVGPTNGEDHVQMFQRTTTTPTNQNTNDACNPGSFPWPTGKSWCTLAGEAKLVRDYAKFSKWRVVDFASTNSLGHPRSIELYSNSQGPGPAFSPFDVFALRTKQQDPGPPRSVPRMEIGWEVPVHGPTDFELWRYGADGESIDGADVVLWYSQKVFHEPRDEEVPSMLWHHAGPTLKVRNWVAKNEVEDTYWLP